MSAALGQFPRGYKSLKPHEQKELVHLVLRRAEISDGLGVVNPADEVMNLLGESLPPEAATLIREQVQSITQTRDAHLLSIGIVGAIWAASSGFGALMRGMNRVYGVKETRPIWRRYALAVAFTLLAGGLILLSLLLMLVGQIYGVEVADKLGLEGAAATLFTIARWPVGIALILLAVAFLYWKPPKRRSALPLDFARRRRLRHTVDGEHLSLRSLRLQSR